MRRELEIVTALRKLPPSLKLTEAQACMNVSAEKLRGFISAGFLETSTVDGRRYVTLDSIIEFYKARTTPISKDEEHLRDWEAWVKRKAAAQATNRNATATKPTPQV